VVAGNTLPVLLTDAELCELLRIGKATLLRHLEHGPPSRHRDAIDVRKLHRCHVGGERRWGRDSVLGAINGIGKKRGK